MIRRTTTGLVLTLPAKRELVRTQPGSADKNSMMWVATEKRVAIMTKLECVAASAVLHD